MPYLSPRDRQTVRVVGPMTPGGLNFAITELCISYISNTAGGIPSYAERAEVYGTLLSAAAEWYRRVIAPYEDEKSWANGDVYPARLTDVYPARLTGETSD